MLRIIATLALWLALGKSALGAVTIVASGTGSATPSPSSPSSGQAFTLTTSGSVLVKVYADSSTDIGRITLTGSGTVSLLIGSSGSFPTNQRDAFVTFLSRDFSGLALSSFSGTIKLAGAVGQDLKGSITADEVFRLDIGRDVTDSITVTGVDPGASEAAMGPVDVGRSITSAGGVFATAVPGMGETLKVLEVMTGVTTSGSDMAGEIATDHGTILSIVAADDLSGSISGAVLGDSSDPNGTTAIQVGVGTSGAISGPITITGDAYGAIETDGFSGAASVEVGGDLYASITSATNMTDVVVDGSLVTTYGPISIFAQDGTVSSVSIGGNVGPGPDQFIADDSTVIATIGGSDGMDEFTCLGDVYNAQIGSSGAPLGSVAISGDLGPVGLRDASFKPAIICSGFDAIDVLGSVVGEAGAGHVWDCEIRAASTSSGSLLRIGEYLGTHATISVTGGEAHAGQIIINGENDSSLWSGSVVVTREAGTATLATGSSQPDQAPYYERVSSDLGGGAVGLVPFHLYKTDCQPPDNPTGACGFDTVSKAWPGGLGGGTRDTLILRHYGPVFNSTGSAPLKVYVRSLALCNCGIYGDQTSWTDSFANDFQVYAPGSGSREVWVARVLNGSTPQAFSTDYELKIDTVSDSGVMRLRSDDTFAATAPNVAGYPYYINPFCPFVPQP